VSPATSAGGIVPSASPPAPSKTSYLSSPSPELVCGRLDARTCGDLVEFARREIAGAREATTFVADYECEPGAWCAFGFRVFVAFFQDGPSDARWPPTFFIRGASGPETVASTLPEPPPHFADLIVSAGWADPR